MYSIIQFGDQFILPGDGTYLFSGYEVYTNFANIKKSKLHRKVKGSRIEWLAFSTNADKNQNYSTKKVHSDLKK